ncbi:MAG TPA: DUF1080 domain-containing protein [Pirellulales bacterium]|nr:DUF1080 domain-containing protein [Pirellulales bacterium]
MQKPLFAAALLVCIVTSSRAADEKTDKPKNSDSKSDWHSLFDGKSLGDWKPSEFATQGNVEVKDGQIEIGFGDGCSGITWKGKFPKTSYEIRLEAKRVDGVDFFCGLTFPVGDDPCSFICGGWGGAVCGLSSIDGEDASSNDTTKVKDFEKDKWYTIRVRVTPQKIQAWIDDDQMVDQSLADRKISIRSEVEASKPLGIATWKTTGAVRNIEWREMDEKGAKEKAAK